MPLDTKPSPLHRALQCIKAPLRPLLLPFLLRNEPRYILAKRYLSGEGLEIGALNFPLLLPRSARAKYVDRLSSDELRRHYPDLASQKIVDVAITDDANTLATVADNSQDFVIASHVIEHCQNPLAALDNWLRVVRPGGVVFFVVPDKRFTDDGEREITPLAHIVRDYREGPEVSRLDHYTEWLTFAHSRNPKYPASEIPERARGLLERGADIHFHVWTQFEILEMLGYARKETDRPFDVEAVQKNGIELIVVLRKH